jgi:Uma2 family endonuclease
MGTLMRPPRTMLEIYQCLPEGTPVQLINNQLIMSPAPKDIHQKVISKIYRLLADFIEKNHLGETRITPSDVFLNNENIYQPDIYYVSTANLNGFQEDGFHGVPDLIIEFLSPGSEKQDKVDKLKNYEACGVIEYWIVDPKTKKTIGYFNEKGRFEKLSELSGQIHSRLLNTIFTF